LDIYSTNIFTPNADIPVLDEKKDPRGWFKTYATGFVLDDDHHVSILRVAPNAKGYEKITRSDLRRGDIVQAKVSFDAYKFRSQSAGVRIQLEELMVLRGAREMVYMTVSKIKRHSDRIFVLSYKFTHVCLVLLASKKEIRRQPAWYTNQVGSSYIEFC
jgi:hypothetical protein